MLHEHGVSISYDRVLEISAQLGDATVSKYVEDGVFTTAAMDNIDHNPTATTATTSFHGTSTQPRMTKEKSVNHSRLEERRLRQFQNSVTASPISDLPSLPRISLLLQRVM